MQNLDLWRNRRVPNSLFRDIWSVFDEASDRQERAAHRESTFPLACDISEADGSFLVSFDIPGLKKEDISIEMSGNQLTVSGERRQQKEVKTGQTFRTERTFGKFSRTFELPEGTSPEGIEASYEQGVLNVAIPKAEVSKSRKIAIGDGFGPKGNSTTINKIEAKTVQN